MSDFSIQHAIWKGKLVEAHDPEVVSGKKSGFVCAGCDKSLFLKKDALFPYFVHASKSFCSPESRIHKTVKRWIVELLPCSIIPLPPHPGLKSPCEFFVCGCKAEVYDNLKGEKNRFDVRAEGLFLYDDNEYINKDSFLYDFGNDDLEQAYYWNTDFYKGDVNRVLNFYRYLIWRQEYYAKELRNSYLSPCKGKSWEKMVERTNVYYKMIFPVKYLLDEYFKRPVSRREVHPYFFKSALDFSEYEKSDHLIIEVKYKNKKYDKFKSEIQKKGYYAFEVDAENFYGSGQGLSVLNLIKNSEWLWFTDAERKQEQSKGQMGLFV